MIEYVVIYFSVVYLSQYDTDSRFTDNVRLPAFIRGRSSFRRKSRAFSLSARKKRKEKKKEKKKKKEKQTQEARYRTTRLDPPLYESREPSPFLFFLPFFFLSSSFFLSTE